MIYLALVGIIVFTIILILYVFNSTSKCSGCVANNNEERWYCYEGKCQQDINKNFKGKTYTSKSTCEKETKQCSI